MTINLFSLLILCLVLVIVAVAVKVVMKQLEVPQGICTLVYLLLFVVALFLILGALGVGIGPHITLN